MTVFLKKSFENEDVTVGVDDVFDSCSLVKCVLKMEKGCAVLDTRQIKSCYLESTSIEHVSAS